MSTSTTIFTPLLTETHRFLQNDLPLILQNAAHSLHKSKLFPTSLSSLQSYTQSDYLDVIPVLCALFVAIISPLLLLLRRKPRRDTYEYVRTLLLRGCALCYLCGGLVSAIQHRTLWGSYGLNPAWSSKEGLYRDGRPTPIFDLLGYSDLSLEIISWLCVFLALCLIKYESMIIAALLWCCYLSLINVQAAFTYSYGWEWLTCEAGFLAIFLCSPPFLKLEAPFLVVWLFRWMAFRLLLGAGMSKVGRNSSDCWRELTCTTTHYFTQPIPNPMSRTFHFLPVDVHRVEVAMTFFEQLVLPFFMLVPWRWARIVAGVGEIFFQFCIVGTGNYAWINFVGALPCLALFDDDFVRACYAAGCKMMFIFKWRKRKDTSQNDCEELVNAQKIKGSKAIEETETLVSTSKKFKAIRQMAIRAPLEVYKLLYKLSLITLFLFMAYKSKDPLLELFSPAPWINNYDNYFFMTSQGVFGFINRLRVQPVLEFQHNSSSDWKPLDFKCLPGSLNRTPCLLSPYHQRLDWETWIRTTASFEQVVERYDKDTAGRYMQDNTPQFLKTLIERILEGDESTGRLMGVTAGELFRFDGNLTSTTAKDVFSKRRERLLPTTPPKSQRRKIPPSSIRLTYYLYTFGKKSIWKRKRIGEQRIYGNTTTKNNKQQKIRTRYYSESSQWRHWICGLALLLLFLSLGDYDTQGILISFFCRQKLIKVEGTEKRHLLHYVFDWHLLVTSMVAIVIFWGALFYDYPQTWVGVVSGWISKMVAAAGRYQFSQVFDHYLSLDTTSLLKKIDQDVISYYMMQYLVGVLIILQVNYVRKFNFSVVEFLRIVVVVALGYAVWEATLEEAL